VASLAAKFLPQSVIGKLDWIVQRTAFIDGQLQSFLQDTDEGARRQVLVLGSGYDTRCLRYGNLPELGFYCVDLPAVSSNCGKIVDRYRKDVDGTTPNAPTFVPLDLNDVGSTGTSLLETLSCSGFVTDGSVPTMVLCEAVLFYLKPESAQSITGELFSLPQSRYCLTDNLSKVGVIPGGGPEGPPPVAARSRCEAWLKNNDKDLVDHDSIWGGAIHFVGARESSK
jgi:O-methyltransferase involved in polyketide biosynthesis